MTIRTITTITIATTATTTTTTATTATTTTTTIVIGDTIMVATRFYCLVYFQLEHLQDE